MMEQTIFAMFDALGFPVSPWQLPFALLVRFLKWRGEKYA